MPVIHDSFIFTRIQKTGTSSMVAMLSEAFKGNGLSLTKPDHVALRFLDQDVLKNKFKFTIARNPFARQFSWFQHYIRTLDPSAPIPMFEKYFCNRAVKPDFWQQYYLHDVDMFDKIYQTEKYEEMVDDLEVKLGKSLRPIQYIGKEFGFDRDYRRFYSPNMIDLVVKSEPVLMQLFNYTF